MCVSPLSKFNVFGVSLEIYKNGPRNVLALTHLFVMNCIAREPFLAWYCIVAYITCKNDLTSIAMLEEIIFRGLDSVVDKRTCLASYLCGPGSNPGQGM